MTSLLRARECPACDGIRVLNPAVGEVLDYGELRYYQMASLLVATPYEMMVQLDDMGIDFENVSPFDLFISVFLASSKDQIALHLPGIDPGSFRLHIEPDAGVKTLLDEAAGIEIDADAHSKIVAALRQIVCYSVRDKKPANAETKRYMIERARKKQRRNAQKPFKPYLESQIISMVNTPEFKYDYESVMSLGLYSFNVSVRQVQKRVQYDHLMTGCYSGSIDMTKLDSAALSWISQ